MLTTLLRITLGIALMLYVSPPVVGVLATPLGAVIALKIFAVLLLLADCRYRPNADISMESQSYIPIDNS